MPILGLHHVTATVDDAQDDLDFCVGGLGLRLVKKTVNFDNHHVYHFYYGDERGTPGTIWTTFPYKDRGVPVGTKGAGQVDVTSFSVPAGSLTVWRRGSASAAIAVTDIEPRFGEAAVRFCDTSGLEFELIATDRDDRDAVGGGDVARRDAAIRGLHSVTMVVRDRRQDARADDRAARLRRGRRDGQPDSRRGATAAVRARRIDVAHEPNAQPAMNGIGTVHHVAMAIAQRGRAAASARGADSSTAARSPRCAIAAISSRFISASLAACCSRWRRWRRGSRSTRTLRSWARAEAAALGGAEPRGHRSRAGAGERSTAGRLMPSVTVLLNPASGGIRMRGSDGEIARLFAAAGWQAEHTPAAQRAGSR